MKVHKLVYLTWVGEIQDGMQINHIDDDKNNNYYKNLYQGTQKENIEDCIRNEHRKNTNVFYLIIKEKKTNKMLIFQPANKFIEYSGHSCKNGSIKKMISKQWFNDEYELISIGKGVTTIESDFEKFVSKVG